MMWAQIELIIQLTCINLCSLVPDLKCCMEILGFDIMLDEKMKPWLLEVNNFPFLEPNVLDRFLLFGIFILTTVIISSIFGSTSLIVVLITRLSCQLVQGWTPRPAGNPPRGEGGVPCSAPHCGEGGAPRPAP